MQRAPLYADFIAAQELYGQVLDRKGIDEKVLAATSDPSQEKWKI